MKSNLGQIKANYKCPKYLVRDIKQPILSSPIFSKTVFFSVLAVETVFFQLLKLRKIRGKNGGKQNWWFDVTNNARNSKSEKDP